MVKQTLLPKGIRRLTSTKFKIEVYHKGFRGSVTVIGTEEDAKDAQQTLLHELKQKKAAADALFNDVGGDGENGKKTCWTLQDAFTKASTLRWRGAKSEQKSIANAKLAVTFFGPHTPVQDITTARVDDYVEHLITHHKSSDSTINRKLSALSVMLTLAQERGFLESLPKLTRRKEYQGRIGFFTPAVEEHILNCFLHIDKKDHYEATIVLIDTGFRPGELWRCTAADINPYNKSITLWETKTDYPRTIPMTARVAEIIERRCLEHPYGPLFPGSSNDWFTNGWDRMRALLHKTTDPEFIPYTLRHTCCSRLVQRGVPLNHVKEWMGHKSIQTTMRYAHLAPHDLFTLASVLEGDETTRWHDMRNEQPEHNTLKQ